MLGFVPDSIFHRLIGCLLPIAVAIPSLPALAQSGDRHRYAVQVVDEQGQPLSGGKLKLTEQIRTLDILSNRTYRQPLDANGVGVIEFVEQNEHYFDSRLCVRLGSQEHCRELKPPFREYCWSDGFFSKGHLCTRAEQRHECGFNRKVEAEKFDPSIQDYIVSCRKLPDAIPVELR